MHSVTTAPPRHALLVCGAPGAGKSTVGALVAQELRAVLLDLDTASASLMAVVAEVHGTSDPDDPQLARLTRTARYESILRLAEDNLAVGLSVVMVAPFTTERRDPRAWNTVSDRLRPVGATTTMVWLRISAEEVRRRVEQRGADRDLGKLRGSWPPTVDLDPPAVPHMEVDALQPPSTIAAAVVSALRSESRT